MSDSRQLLHDHPIGQIAEREFRDQPALSHHQDPVSNPPNELQVLFNQQYREPLLRRELIEVLGTLIDNRRLDTFAGLVSVLAACCPEASSSFWRWLDASLVISGWS